MLYVVAVKHFGRSGAAVVARPTRRGALVRLGGSSDDTMRLAGTRNSAELYCDGRSWFARTPDGTRRMRDVDMIDLDAWHITVLLEPQLGEGPKPVGGDRPWFASSGESPCFIEAGAPVLLGSARWCALRFENHDVPSIAIVRRNASGQTWLYPIPGIEIRVNTDEVCSPVRLRDGAQVEAAGSAVPAPIVYCNPRDEVDRLLGITDPEPAESAPTSVANQSLLEKLHTRFGSKPDALATPLELALAAVTAGSVVTFAAVLFVCW